MNIVNELLNAVRKMLSSTFASCRVFQLIGLSIQVKLVKFYAWENRWIDRVLDARKFELKWLVKGMSII